MLGDPWKRVLAGGDSHGLSLDFFALLRLGAPEHRPCAQGWAWLASSLPEAHLLWLHRFPPASPIGRLRTATCRRKARLYLHKSSRWKLALYGRKNAGGPGTSPGEAVRSVRLIGICE